MTTVTEPYVAYEVRIPAGVPHRGITKDPEQVLAEYRERLGPDAFIQILTPPLSLREAKQWEAMMERNRTTPRNQALGWGSVTPLETVTR